MNYCIRSDREKNQDELIRRMAEPDDLRALRKQMEQIEDEMEQSAQRFQHNAEKERLRRKIRELGHKPVA